MNSYMYLFTYLIFLIYLYLLIVSICLDFFNKTRECMFLGFHRFVFLAGFIGMCFFYLFLYCFYSIPFLFSLFGGN